MRIYNYKYTKTWLTHSELRYHLVNFLDKSNENNILEIDLGDNIFTCGQGYTALSRAKSLKCIKIIDVSKESFKINPYVKAFYNNVKI